MAGEAIFRLSSSGPTVPGRGWGASGSPLVTASRPGSASTRSVREVMSTILPDSPLPALLGPWPGASSVCAGLCLGYVWGNRQGIRDLCGHCGGWGAFLGEVSDGSWETGLHAPRTSKRGPGSAVYTPCEQVRSAVWGTPRPANSEPAS